MKNEQLDKTSTNEFYKAFDLPNPGLRAYFSHVREGSDEIYRTPFFKGRSLDEILDGWHSHLTKIKDVWPSLYEFEIDLGEKVGPMSVMKPLKDRMSDIDAYYDLVLKPSKPIPESAILSTVSEWRAVSGLRIRSLSRTVEVMKKSTNSGSPFFTKRKLVLHKTFPSCIKDGRQFLPSGIYDYVAILGWRGQEGGRSPEDVKQRVVWMFPFAVNAQELRVYQPLISSAQRFKLVPAWVSMDEVDREITKMFDTKHPDDLVICTDFSKFDQHFNADLQSAANTILKSIFTNNADFNDWLEDVFPIKYNIPLAYDWEKVRSGAHGMGSGSGGTNADETLVHRSLQHEAALAAGKQLNPHSQCLGDDGVLTYPGITVDDVVSVYSSHGQDMNPDKQYASKHDCVYLRRWHHKDYRPNGTCAGVYSTNRALGRLAEQERYYDPDKWSKEMVALRQLSILENVKWHPLREEFVDYCIKGDKYRLGLDIPGFFENLTKLASQAIDEMPDFLGYTKSLQNDGDPEVNGIASWWIVNYLKSKA